MAINAARWRDERLREHNIVLAWQTANLTRAKRMPSLKQLLNIKPAKPLKGKQLQIRRQEFKEMTASIDLEKLAKQKARKSNG